MKTKKVWPAKGDEVVLCFAVFTTMKIAAIKEIRAAACSCSRVSLWHFSDQKVGVNFGRVQGKFG